MSWQEEVRCGKAKGMILLSGAFLVRCRWPCVLCIRIAQEVLMEDCFLACSSDRTARDCMDVYIPALRKRQVKTRLLSTRHFGILTLSLVPLLFDRFPWLYFFQSKIKWYVST